MLKGKASSGVGNQENLTITSQMSEQWQELDFYESLLTRFKEDSSQSILNKRVAIAKSDPSEEVYELHLEIQAFEKQFRECVDISGIVIKKNRDLLQIVTAKSDPSFAEQQSNDLKIEVQRVTEKSQQQVMELEDQKDKYRSLKARCQELEKIAQDRQEKSNYWQTLCEQAKKANPDNNNSSEAAGGKIKSVAAVEEL